MYMYTQKNLMITTKLVNICSIVYMYFNRFYKVNNNNNNNNKIQKFCIFFIIHRFNFLQINKKAVVYILYSLLPITSKLL